MKVSAEEINEIEKDTREQHASGLWERERRKRITASTVGTLLKMRRSTKRSKKVEGLKAMRIINGDNVSP